MLAAPTTASTEIPDGLIAITVNELRRLFRALVIDPVRRVADVIAWSIRRRKHRNQAKTSHYARQARTEPYRSPAGVLNAFRAGEPPTKVGRRVAPEELRDARSSERALTCWAVIGPSSRAAPESRGTASFPT